MAVIHYILTVVFILGIGIVFMTLFIDNSESNVTYVIFSLIILALILVLNLKKGTIQADEEKIQISRYLFGRRVFNKNIAYYDIDRVECCPYLENGRNAYGRYRLVMTIKENNGNERSFYTNLNISKHMPVQNPDKYKRFIETHPMMELSMYINKEIRQSKSE